MLSLRFSALCALHCPFGVLLLLLAQSAGQETGQRFAGLPVVVVEAAPQGAAAGEVARLKERAEEVLREFERGYLKAQAALDAAKGSSRASGAAGDPGGASPNDPDAVRGSALKVPSILGLRLHVRPASRVLGRKTRDTRPFGFAQSEDQAPWFDCVAGQGWEHVPAVAGAFLALSAEDPPWPPALAMGFAQAIGGAFEGGRPARALLGRVARALPLPLDHLLATKEAELKSLYLLLPYADALLHDLLSDPSAFAAFCADPSLNDPAAKRALRERFDRVVQAAIAECAEPLARRPWPQMRLAGYCFAHEGYQVFDGYGSLEAFASLRAIQREGGGSAVALTPFAIQRWTDQGLLSHQSGRDWANEQHYRGGVETAEALRQSLLDARALGLSVVLKPHVWVPRSWPGAIDLKDPAEARAWFDSYREYILKWTIFGEINRVDVMILATELGPMVQRWPELAREIFRAMRHVTAAPIVYAANWDEPLEHLPINEFVDAIGVDLYPSLAHGDPKATDLELSQSAREIALTLDGIAERTAKPILVCELGYPRRSAAWVTPHDPKQRTPDGDAAQARAYAAMMPALEAFALRAGPERFAGALIWKWPSWLGYEADGSYQPRAVPATELVAKALRQIAAIASGGNPRSR